MINTQPTRFERFLASVAPGFARDRYRQRVAFEYEAAKQTRLRGSASTLSNPETYRGARDRITLMREARDLIDNFPLFAALNATTEMYVVGELNYQPQTGDAVADKEFKAYLDEYLFNGCDLSGRMGYEELIGLAYMQANTDGDFGIVTRRAGDRLYLQGIEADRIGDPNDCRIEDGYVGGITYDRATGRPLSYRVYRRTPAEGYVDPVEVSPLDFAHICMRKRHDEQRGRSRFAAALKHARDVKEILEAERIGVKFDSHHAGVAYTETGMPDDDPQAFIDGAERTGDNRAVKEEDMPMGKIRYLKRTSKFEFLHSNRPSATFNGFIETLNMDMSITWPLPVEFILALKGTGPMVRASAAKAQRTFNRDRCRLKRQALERHKNAFLLNGMAHHGLKMVEGWDRGQWHFPPALTIDVGRDSKAGIDEWRAGLLTADEWAGEEGKDWRARMRQKFVEAKEAETLGAEFKLDPATVIQVNPKAPVPASDDGPDADKVGPG